MKYQIDDEEQQLRQQQQGTKSAGEKADEVVKIRSRTHGNNQEWSPLYCIMLLALIYCNVDPILWHVLAWFYMVIRLYLWVVWKYTKDWKRIGVTINYILYFVVSIIVVIHGIIKLMDNK